MASVTIIPLNTSDSGAISRVTINTNFDNINAELANSLGYTGATANLDLGSFLLVTSGVKASGAGGILLEANGGTDIGTLGVSSTSAVSWEGSHTYNGATADTIASFNSSKVLTSLSTSTYPSLVELAYVKGVTSALQTQLNAKAPLASPSFTGTVTTAGSIELGHASDTTLSRLSAGVLAVEGVSVSMNSTSATHTAGTIELGNASDTTLSRSSAGVLAVEGVVIPSISSTNTITNKRNTKRITTTNAPGATPTTNTDNVDIMAFTGLSAAITSMTTNLSGTPVNGDLLMFQFTDNGTARAITWGSSFAATTVTLPTTTVISTLLRVLFQWNSTTSKWECIATA